MPKLVWQCDVCHKLHPTCDLSAKCERSHPPGSVYCEHCKGTGELDQCDGCNGAGTVVTAQTIESKGE